jgi:hypothetical protein
VGFLVGLLGGFVGLLGGFVGLLGGSVGLLGGLVGGLFVDGIGVFDVFGDRVAVFVGRMMKVEPVAVGDGVLVAVGVSRGFTGRRGISAM